MFPFKPEDYPTRVERAGVPFTTPRQIHVLRWLYDPNERPVEQPFKVIDLAFLGLPRQAHVTVPSLIERDWIVASTKAFAEVRYQITPRGIKALKLINQSTRKQYADHLCSRCRKNPRKQYASRLYTHCQECVNEIQRKKRKFKGNMHDPNKLCSRCRQARRLIGASGYVYVYCQSCQRELWRESHYRNRARKAS